MSDENTSVLPENGAAAHRMTPVNMFPVPVCVITGRVQRGNSQGGRRFRGGLSLFYISQSFSGPTMFDGTTVITDS